MCCKISQYMNRFIWCIPALIVTIGVIYFINLFDRIYSRDLNRQLEEKYQLVNLIEALHNKESMVNIVEIMDEFKDTSLYVLELNDKNEIIEDFHTTNCPYRFQTHPYELKAIQKQIKSNKRGFFMTKLQSVGKIYWEYRWLNIENKRYLLLMGIANYPTDVLDVELQVSVGTLLLITALLNWILVGYAKYLKNGNCAIRKKKLKC